MRIGIKSPYRKTGDIFKSLQLYTMNAKLKQLMLCAVLAISVYGAFAQTEQEEIGGGQTATCDASNTNKCVITNVGEGTGKLIVSN